MIQCFHFFVSFMCVNLVSIERNDNENQDNTVVETSQKRTSNRTSARKALNFENDGTVQRRNEVTVVQNPENSSSTCNFLINRLLDSIGNGIIYIFYLNSVV